MFLQKNHACWCHYLLLLWKFNNLVFGGSCFELLCTRALFHDMHMSSGKVPSQGSTLYKSLCKSVSLPVLSSKKLHSTENLFLKIFMWCFLQGTSLLRQTLLPHCEQVTIHGVTFRMPSWASLRDLVEPFPVGGLCPLADKLL